MKRRRSRLETIYIILVLARNGIKKTHIMYRANLSHQQLNKYLATLTGKQLLRKGDDAYYTTQQGLAFIAKFQDILTLMGENETSNISSPEGFLNFAP